MSDKYLRPTIRVYTDDTGNPRVDMPDGTEIPLITKLVMRMEPRLGVHEAIYDPIVQLTILCSNMDIYAQLENLTVLHDVDLNRVPLGRLFSIVHGRLWELEQESVDTTEVHKALAELQHRLAGAEEKA